MGDRPEITVQPGYLLYKAGVLSQQAFDDALDAVDLTPRQFLVLAFIDADPLSQQDLARRMGLDPTLIGQIVDELEERDLARRDRDPADRRRYVLGLTATGRRRLGKATSLAREAEADLLGPLSAAERRALGDLVLRVVTPRLAWLQDHDEPEPSRGG